MSQSQTPAPADSWASASRSCVTFQTLESSIGAEMSVCETTAPRCAPPRAVAVSRTTASVPGVAGILVGEALAPALEHGKDAVAHRAAPSAPHPGPPADRQVIGSDVRARRRLARDPAVVEGELPPWPVDRYDVAGIIEHCDLRADGIENGAIELSAARSACSRDRAGSYPPGRRPPFQGLIGASRRRQGSVIRCVQDQHSGFPDGPGFSTAFRGSCGACRIGHEPSSPAGTRSVDKPVQPWPPSCPEGQATRTAAGSSVRAGSTPWRCRAALQAGSHVRLRQALDVREVDAQALHALQACRQRRR